MTEEILVDAQETGGNLDLEHLMQAICNLYAYVFEFHGMGDPVPP